MRGGRRDEHGDDDHAAELARLVAEIVRRGLERGLRSGAVSPEAALRLGRKFAPGSGPMAGRES